MKKEKIMRLLSMITIITIPMVILARQYAAMPYPQQSLQSVQTHVTDEQCRFKKIYKNRHKLKDRNISKLLALKQPYNKWPLARRQLLRERLHYMKEMLNQLMINDQDAVGAINNLQLRIDALNNM